MMRAALLCRTLLAVFAWAAALLIGRGASPTPAAAQGDWAMLGPADGGLCARGTPYVWWSRTRDPASLLVYFQGGGMCWDAATCAPGFGAFDEVIEGGEVGAYTRGIFDDANPENPLATYSAVFIPYCTGDWHTGARTVEYGDPAGTVYHNGYANAQAAIAWTLAAFPRPARVVIAGCSAGAYGAAYHAPTLTRRYRGAAVFGDAASGVVPATWGGLDVWGTFDHAPARTTPDVFVNRLWTAAMRAGNRGRFGQYAPTGDGVQQYYLGLMGGGDWAGGRAASLAALDASPAFTAFPAETAEHCILETDRFYSEITPDGARFRDAWAAWAGG